MLKFQAESETYGKVMTTIILLSSAILLLSCTWAYWSAIQSDNSEHKSLRVLGDQRR
jgi:hypothetical protein